MSSTLTIAPRRLAAPGGARRAQQQSRGMATISIARALRASEDQQAASTSGREEAQPSGRRICPRCRCVRLRVTP